MFSRRERLSRADFKNALKTSRRVSSAYFLILAPEKIKGYAVVIPKKVIRLSTDRHRLKRQVLEALRTLPLPPSLVIFPRSLSSSVHYQDLVFDLRKLLSKIHP